MGEILENLDPVFQFDFAQNVTSLLFLSILLNSFMSGEYVPLIVNVGLYKLN